MCGGQYLGKLSGGNWIVIIKSLAYFSGFSKSAVVLALDFLVAEVCIASSF